MLWWGSGAWSRSSRFSPVFLLPLLLFFFKLFCLTKSLLITSGLREGIKSLRKETLFELRQGRGFPGSVRWIRRELASCFTAVKRSKSWKEITVRLRNEHKPHILKERAAHISFSPHPRPKFNVLNFPGAGGCCCDPQNRRERRLPRATPI